MIKTSLSLLLLLMASQALAAQLPAPLQAPAIPVDTRCSMSSNSREADLGNLSRWQLQPAAEGGDKLSLGKRDFNVNVTCPFSQSMQLVVNGDRNSAGGFRYGRNGELRIVLKEATLDGQPVQVRLLPMAKVSTAGNLNLKPDLNLQVVAANGNVVKGKSLSLLLETEPVLREADARVSRRQSDESNFSLQLIN